MLVDVVWFVGGLALLLPGGQSLVRGASGLARSLGVAPIVIGLAVLAFGTSAPEFMIAVISAATRSGGVAYGNAVCPSIVNLALILGVTALVWPLAEEQMSKMGVAAFEQLKKDTPETKDQSLLDYVPCVASRLITKSGSTNWEVQVFDSTQVNAFALPGGKIAQHPLDTPSRLTLDQLGFQR